MVLSDVVQGYVSEEAARSDFGVVLTDAGIVEHAATITLRKERTV
jgi:hypothetical protein